MERYIFNGGLEQGLLEAVNEDGLLSKADKERLEYLKSLPANRYEFEKEGESLYIDLSPKQSVKIKQKAVEILKKYD